MVIATLALRVIKTAYFILLFLIVGATTPRPESYLDYNFARKVCDFIYGVISADNMYDTFFYIAFMVVISITLAIYIITVKLIRKIRSKR